MQQRWVTATKLNASTVAEADTDAYYDYWDVDRKNNAMPNPKAHHNDPNKMKIKKRADWHREFDATGRPNENATKFMPDKRHSHFLLTGAVTSHARASLRKVEKRIAVHLEHEGNLTGKVGQQLKAQRTAAEAILLGADVVGRFHDAFDDGIERPELLKHAKIGATASINKIKAARRAGNAKNKRTKRKDHGARNALDVRTRHVSVLNPEVSYSSDEGEPDSDHGWSAPSVSDDDWDDTNDGAKATGKATEKKDRRAASAMRGRK